MEMEDPDELPDAYNATFDSHGTPSCCIRQTQGLTLLGLLPPGLRRLWLWIGGELGTASYGV